MKRDGTRIKMHPAEVRGKWITRRRVAFALLVAVYVIAPLVSIRGQPLIQLDVAHRRFYFFGSTFNAQDFWMILPLILALVFALLAVTAWKGRVWCGWACPQTVFLEGVYRPIEQLFEGSRERRIRFDAEPWSMRKALRKAAKFFVYLFISLNIAQAAAAIFVGPKELWAMILEGPLAHREAFVLVMGFAAVLQFNFTWFREQFCVIVCPYGRMQSVLHDRKSVTVSYAVDRGEPRGKPHLEEGAAKQGDCVDCGRCVAVCPTGIDIRNGLQMECVACLQCIDACDEIMTKLKKPIGLIGFASQNERQGKKRELSVRVLVYAALALLSVGALGFNVVARVPFEANVIRPRGANPFVVDGQVIRNTFQVHVFNKNPRPSRLRVEIVSPVPASIVLGVHSVELPSLADANVPVAVSIERHLLASKRTLTLKVFDEASGEVVEKPIPFLAPP
jgi:cytochrome c oxidase accessory protein FixG